MNKMAVFSRESGIIVTSRFSIMHKSLQLKKVMRSVSACPIRPI